MKLSDFKIGIRLGAAFAVTLALLMVVAGIGLVSIQATDAFIDDIVHDNVVKMDLVNEMSEQVHIVSRVLRTLVLLNEVEQIKTEKQKIDDARKKYDTASTALNKMPASDTGKALRAKIEAARGAARDVNDRVVELAFVNKDAEALELLLKTAAPKVAAWQAALDENGDLQRKNNDEA